MASPNANFDQFATTTYNNYRKTLADNVMKRVKLLSFMQQKGRVERKKGGVYLIEPLMYELNSTFKTYSGYDTLDTTPQEGITSAQYSWKNAAVGITVSKEDLDVNAGNVKIIDLLKSKIDQAQKTITQRMNAMLFSDGTGNGGKDMQGLETFLRANPALSVSIGGINQSTYDWWRNQYDTCAVFSTDGLAEMRQMFNNCSKNGDEPKAIMCDQDTFEAYEALLVPIERAVYSGKPLNGDLGFGKLEFKGVPMDWDYNCGSQRMYFLNTDYLKLVIDSDTDFTMTEWRVPVNQMAKSCFILLRGQLVCSNRLVQGRLAITAY